MVTGTPDQATLDAVELGGRARRAAGADRVVVLVDGRSGSGKSTLGRALATELDAQLVRLDDFYTGWGGLQSGSDMVVADVLRAEDAGWRRWDWQADAPAEWHPLDASRGLVIEGCGALSRRSSALATLRIWVELDPVTRRERALARDGVVYEEYWDRWAEQERRFIERERPQELADIILQR